MDTSMEAKSEFKLSTTLGCKESGIRDVAAASDDLLCTCEERGSINVWERKSGERDFVIKQVPKLPYPHEKGFTFCVESAKLSYPPGTFISGGADKTARPINISGEEFVPLIGHTNCVNSISETSEGLLVTGSWDGTARIWKNNQTLKVLGGHEHAVEVLGLPSGHIVTASANRHIIIYDNEGREVKKIPNAHTHTIRKLISHPFGFASCGNDGYVRVWSLQGENLLTIDTHSQAEPAFVYGLTLLNNGDFAACGEDGNVRIWAADGSHLVQTLRHPGPVRALKTLPNGDLLTACADKCARIFTRSASRIASDADLAEYESYVSLVTASGNMKELDTENLPDETALLQPGKKNGDIKVVKVGGKGMVFKWNATKLEWEMFGEAVGRKSQNKVKLNGKEYDFVTDVFVDESNRSIPLGINRDDDPDDLAHHFCTIHGVPFDVKQQIVNHIRPMTDPHLVALRKTNEKALHDATALIHVPAWASEGFQLHSEFKSGAFKAKILQLSSSSSDGMLTEGEQVILGGLVKKMEDKPNYHTSTLNKDELMLINKLLTWPSAALPPVLDGIRILMCLTYACKLLMSDSQFQNLIFKHAQEGTHVHQTLLLKALTNWLAKREKVSTEKQQINPELLAYIQRTLAVFGPIATSETAPASLFSAFVLFVYNLVVWLGRVNPKQGSGIFRFIAPGLLLGLRKPEINERTAFYALLSLGTMCYCDNDVLPAERLSDLRLVLKNLHEKFRGSVGQVAQDCSRVFGI